MTVIGEAGIVGVVKSVTSSSSIVILMSDPSFRIGVRIAGTQSVGILLGQGSDRYTLQLLDPTGTIKFGDALLSLGSDNNRPFVPGLPVGSVSSVDHSNSALTQTASVVGYTNLNALGVVSVIVSAAKQDPKDSLVPTPDPIKTIYVTPSPTSSLFPSGSLSPSPQATPTGKKK
jgi:rod shape-determining protein MreC